jgi:hypothetical protein
MRSRLSELLAAVYRIGAQHVHPSGHADAVHRDEFVADGEGIRSGIEGGVVHEIDQDLAIVNICREREVRFIEGRQNKFVVGVMQARGVTHANIVKREIVVGSAVGAGQSQKLLSSIRKGRNSCRRGQRVP